MKYIIVVLSLVSSSFVVGQYVEATQLIQYKACNSEELHQELTSWCFIAARRNSGSDLAIGPYGSPSMLEEEIDDLPILSEDVLKEIVQRSSPVPTRGRRRHMQRRLQIRSAELSAYLSSCCDEYCSISVEELKSLTICQNRQAP